jgi:hypothetical protein
MFNISQIPGSLQVTNPLTGCWFFCVRYILDRVVSTTCDHVCDYGFPFTIACWRPLNTHQGSLKERESLEPSNVRFKWNVIEEYGQGERSSRIRGCIQRMLFSQYWLQGFCSSVRYWIRRCNGHRFKLYGSISVDSFYNISRLLAEPIQPIPFST